MGRKLNRIRVLAFARVAIFAIAASCFLEMVQCQAQPNNAKEENRARNPLLRWKRSDSNEAGAPAVAAATVRELSLLTSPLNADAESPAGASNEYGQKQNYTSTKAAVGHVSSGLNTSTNSTNSDGMRGRGLFGNMFGGQRPLINVDLLGSDDDDRRGSLLNVNVLGRGSKGLLDVDVLGGGGGDKRDKCKSDFGGGSLLHLNVLGSGREKSGSLLDVGVLNRGGSHGKSSSLLNVGDINRGGSGSGKSSSLLNVGVLNGGRSGSLLKAEVLKSGSGSGKLLNLEVGQAWLSVFDTSPEDSSEEEDPDCPDRKRPRTRGNGKGRKRVDVKVDLFHGQHTKKPGPSEKVIPCNSTVDFVKNRHRAHRDETFIIQSHYFGTRKQYPRGTSCRWQLKGSTKCVLAFQCHKIDIRENCTEEFLQIFDGVSPLRASVRLCRKISMLKPIRARLGQNINVHFRTGSSAKFKRRYKGFQCKAKCSADPKVAVPLPAPPTPLPEPEPSTSHPEGPKCHYRIQEKEELLEDAAQPREDICQSPFKNITIRPNQVLRVHSTNYIEEEAVLNYPNGTDCQLFIYGNEDCLVSATCWNMDLRRFGRETAFENCTREFVEISDGYGFENTNANGRGRIRLCHGKLLRDPFRASPKLLQGAGVPGGLTIRFKTDPSPFDRMYDGYLCMFACELKVCEDPAKSAAAVPGNALHKVLGR